MNKQRKGSPKPNGKRVKDNTSFDPSECKAPRVRDFNKDASNDWTWYAANKTILDDAARFAFSDVAGLPLNIRTKASTSPANEQVVNMPGIQVFKHALTLGMSLNGNSALNTASRNIYSYIRHANSGSANYEAPDLMCYIGAVDSVHAYFMFMVRLYGLLMRYSQKNRFLPRNLIRAMGVDYDDLVQHINDFRGFINMYAVKAGTLIVPSNLSIFSRHRWLNTSMSYDRPSMKAQIFVNMVDSYLQFDPTHPNGSALKVKRFHSGNNATNLITYQGLIDFGNDLLDPLLGNEDIGIMSGDILKAYKDKILAIDQINPDFSIEITQDEAMLYQVQNCTIVDGMDSVLVNGYYAVTQENNELFSHDEFSIKHSATSAQKIRSLSLGTDRVLTAPLADVTPEIVMEMTRSCALLDYSTPSDDLTSVMATVINGSDYIISSFVVRNTGEFATAVYSSVIQGTSAAQLLANVSPFYMHPGYYVWNITGDQAGLTPGQLLNKMILYYVHLEIDNYTTISIDKLKRLHEVAILNELAVPLLGTAFQN